LMHKFISGKNNKQTQRVQQKFLIQNKSEDKTKEIIVARCHHLTVF